MEATIHLKNFPNKKMVPEILKSHDFTWTDLNSDQVRIKGSFSKLKDVNADLEKLHYQPRIPLPSSPVRNASSGAISKHYANNRSDVSDGKRSHLGYGDKPSPASPSLSRRSASFHSRPTSAFPQTRYQHMSHSQGTEFVVDADVFKYAERFRRKDIEVIMCNHNVTPKYLQVGNNINICLQGRSAKIAAGKLQSLLNDLSKSLRTQEVPLNHVVHDGKALLEKIRKDRDIYKSVLVCKLIDRVHLIGPSGESYELKQRLLGKPVDHSGRPGRTLGSGSRERSHSMPPPDRKTTERDIIANPSPDGAQGYSPTRYQSHEEDSDPDFLSSSCFGKSLTKRSKSLSRLKVSPEKSTDDTQDKKTKKANHVFSISPLIKLGTKNEIKQKMRSSKK